MLFAVMFLVCQLRWASQLDTDFFISSLLEFNVKTSKVTCAHLTPVPCLQDGVGIIWWTQCLHGNVVKYTHECKLCLYEV